MSLPRSSVMVEFVYDTVGGNCMSSFAFKVSFLLKINHYISLSDDFNVKAQLSVDLHSVSWCYEIVVKTIPKQTKASRDWLDYVNRYLNFWHLKGTKCDIVFLRDSQEINCWTKIGSELFWLTNLSIYCN